MIELMVYVVLAGCAALLLASLLLRRNVTKKGKPAEQITNLAETVRNAEIINGSFFRSLELVEKNLESLLARANRVEESLRALLPQAELAKTDQYAKASLLLAEGKDAKEISQSLKLPLTQIRLIRELQEGLAVKKQERTVGMVERAAEKRASNEENVTWNELLSGFSPTGNQQAFNREKVAARSNGIR